MAAQLVILLTTSLVSVAALGTGRQVCVAGASTDFAADIYVANAAGATSKTKLLSIRNGQQRSFTNDSSTIMKYTVTAGSLGTGKIWVQGPATGSAEVDLSGTGGQTPATGIDISGLQAPRQLVVAGGPAAMRLSIYVGNSASGSFRVLQTIVTDANGSAVLTVSDNSSFMKYTVDAGTAGSATRVYVTGGDVASFGARAVATSIGANTVSDQVLTVTATGALGAQDGVTIAVGDVVLFPAGLSNVTTGEAGPWTCLTLGDTTTSATFQRPSWWQNGQPIPATNTRISVRAAGTLFPNTTWRNANGAGSTVIGTDEPQLFPDLVIQTVTLSTGIIAVTNVPIYSATKSSIWFERTAVGGTLTTTVQYNAASTTAGPLGTATTTITAMIATGGTNTSDTSTGRCIIQNFA